MDRNLTFDISVLDDDVVPYVGTWIEMLAIDPAPGKHLRRSLRGNVDRNTADDIRLDPYAPSFPTWERG